MSSRISKESRPNRARRLTRETRSRRADPAKSRTRRGRASEDRRRAKLRSIDGRHPLQLTAPSAIVSYPARRRHDSEIAYFNFALAREIGLLPERHPDRLDAALRRSLLDAFSLVIVNEWDEENGDPPPRRDLKPNAYMATRYLQLQHPDKRGKNSGDGRSIWNGMLRTHKGVFDVSSCGTGVTRLCPATSQLGRFFRTGNVITDYGCGTANIDEGIVAALMSEAYARNGIRTERVLAVLSLPSGQAINVRVAPNLLRPSHFFGLLRRREVDDLRACVLYHADREIEAGRWPLRRGEKERIRELPRQVALDFARAAATFEREYIFCWLDWDGDNILTDGSILDYGSVRQFGLYHRDYRFQDVDRLSTSIPEQKRKARQIVQRFVQIRELLLTGRAPSLDSLRRDPCLQLFDREFELESRRRFLLSLGLEPNEADALARRPPPELASLMRRHRRFEKRRSSRGRRRVPDGLSWNAVYCMRDVLRELPGRLLEEGDGTDAAIEPEAFLEIALSDYASRRDRRATAYRRRAAREYQRAYLGLIDRVARRRGETREAVLAEIAPRAAARNPWARMTGDGLTHATRRLTANRSRLAPEETYRLIQAFAGSQDFARETVAGGADDPVAEERPLVRRLHRDIQRLVADYRESL